MTGRLIPICVLCFHRIPSTLVTWCFGYPESVVWLSASTINYRPANEVCEGYVFTPVCQSFCSRGGSLFAPQVTWPGVLSRGVSIWEVSAFGVSVPGGLCPGGEVSVQGDLCPGGSLSGGSLSRRRSLSGGSLSRGVSVKETPRQRHPLICVSGWYTSYWNAFLYYSCTYLGVTDELLVGYLVFRLFITPCDHYWCFSRMFKFTGYVANRFLVLRLLNVCGCDPVRALFGLTDELLIGYLVFRWLGVSPDNANHVDTGLTDEPLIIGSRLNEKWLRLSFPSRQSLRRNSTVKFT